MSNVPLSREPNPTRSEGFGLGNKGNKQIRVGILLVICSTQIPNSLNKDAQIRRFGLKLSKTTWVRNRYFSYSRCGFSSFR